MFVLALRGMSTDLLHHVNSKYISFHDILRNKHCIVLYATLLSTAFILIARRCRVKNHRPQSYSLIQTWFDTEINPL